MRKIPLLLHFAMPCWTKQINYKYIRTHLRRWLNVFQFFWCFVFIATAILFNWIKLSIWNQVMSHFNHSLALHYTQFFCCCKNNHNFWINIILILEWDELDEGSLLWMILWHDKYYNNLTLLELLRVSEIARQNLPCCKTSVSYCRFEARYLCCFTEMTPSKSFIWIKTSWPKSNFEDLYGNITVC